MLLAALRDQLLRDLADLGVTLLLGHIRGQLAVDLFRDVVDPLKKAHTEARRQFILARPGPETVREVVMLNAAEPLHRIVAAVVVREE